MKGSDTDLHYETATVYRLWTTEYTVIPRSELSPHMIRTFDETTAEVIWVDISPTKQKT